MKVHIINQEPLDMDGEDARKIIDALKSGVEYVIVNGEYVKSSAIMGIRNSETDEYHLKLAWGMLPEGTLTNFYDERREIPGQGYKKFKAMKARLLSR